VRAGVNGMKAIRVFCLDHNAADAKLAQTVLTKAGLEYSIMRVETREAFLAAWRRVVLTSFSQTTPYPRTTP
jgi:predicted O-methyltransferase YrrM